MNWPLKAVVSTPAVLRCLLYWGLLIKDKELVAELMAIFTAKTSNKQIKLLNNEEGSKSTPPVLASTMILGAKMIHNSMRLVN
uniref:Uncharacterized protein n=1 Tax=Noccaea caerulescens TaxID=107243 RepID=A0A1J3FVJ1_NOCCA